MKASIIVVIISKIQFKDQFIEMILGLFRYTIISYITAKCKNENKIKAILLNFSIKHLNPNTKRKLKLH